MSVDKYKPKTTPHSLYQSLDRAAEDSKKTVRATKNTIQRSRDLLTKSRATIEQAKRLQRKQA